MTTVGIKPEDVLGDSDNFANLNGTVIRKGSIAAFLKNIELFEAEVSSEQEKTAALEMLRSLAPAIIASNLHKYAVFKNKVIEAILVSCQ